MLGSLSNNDGDGYKNVIKKKWIRAALNFIVLFPSRCILNDSIKVQEKKWKVVHSPFSRKRKIRHFHVLVMQRRLGNIQKKCDARAKLLFSQSKPIAFCRSRWRRRCRCF